MSRWFVVLVMAMSVATAATSQQGSVTGSVRSDDAPITVPEGRSVGDAARAVSDNFALCIVKRHYQQVVKTLAGPPDAMHDYKFLPKLMDGECFTGSSSVGRAYGMDNVELTTNPVAFRGALYKALVRRDFAKRPAIFGATALVMTGDYQQVLQFADCVVSRDPAASLKLVRSIAGTSAEQAALGELRAALDRCTPTEMQMRFSKGILVGYIAEAYFREAQAAGAADGRP